jgi:hypothetical protein
MLSVPGNSDLSSYAKYKPDISCLSLKTERPIIILASNDVNDESLFRNGLTQNIVVLYNLFESLGYESYLLQHSTDTGVNKKSFLNKYKSVIPVDIIRKSMPIRALIEIGMSLDSTTRGYLRSIGAKTIKLYLGNILNIDIETIQNFNNVFFYHHIVDEIDEIWTSPHYKQHIDYAAVLNRCEIKNSRIAPYVWDSCFITEYENKEQIEWIPPSDWRNTDIVIMDPNISFQKTYFYSLLLCEAFSKKYPEWAGKVQIINGDKITLDAYSNNFVLPNLSLHKRNRIILHGRKNIHTILKENRSACFITHQWNNDFNYMTLELLYCNYPILHNSEGWDNFGYHYDINKWDEAIYTMYKALTTHNTNINIYKTHATNLIWKHSIHNPEIQAEWRKLLE